MKKLLVILLSCALVLGAAGCKIKNADQPTAEQSAGEQSAGGSDVQSAQPGETSSDYAGIEISIDALNVSLRENTCELVVLLRNQTRYDVTYGEAFTVERLEGSSWVSCAREGNWAFEAIGYMLKPGSQQTHSYQLSFAYDLSAPGTYRFRTECYVSDHPEQSTKCTLTVQFTVGSGQTSQDSQPPAEPQPPEVPVAYKAQYVRTDGYISGAQYPQVHIIQSAQALDDYSDEWYHNWLGAFFPDSPETARTDITAGLMDACAGYDDAFFEENYLLFVLLEEGSGSIRHEVLGVTQAQDGTLSVSIDRLVPEVGTCDMAQWHIILELRRENAVQSAADTQIYLDAQLAYQHGQVIVPIRPGAFKQPPQGAVITPEGEVPMQIGGYHWFCRTESGLMEATIADQAGRPLPKKVLQPVTIPAKYAETVYAPIPGSTAYAPTNMQGYLVKVHWEDEPTYIRYTCWPEAVWEGAAQEETVYHMENTFYARPGGYVYEITATWEDLGEGYYGEATYYVYITGITDPV